MNYEFKKCGDIRSIALHAKNKVLHFVNVFLEGEKLKQQMDIHNMTLSM